MNVSHIVLLFLSDSAVSLSKHNEVKRRTRNIELKAASTAAKTLVGYKIGYNLPFKVPSAKKRQIYHYVFVHQSCKHYSEMMEAFVSVPPPSQTERGGLAHRREQGSDGGVEDILPPFAP